MDKKLRKLFAILFISFLFASFFLPVVLYRSSPFVHKIAWRVSSFGQQAEHETNRTLYDPQAGAVMIIFDDGWSTQFTHGYKIMSEYGFVGTVSVISSAVGQYGYMDLWDLSEMYRAGWDMANHTEHHLWLHHLGIELQRREILSCLDWLKECNLSGAEDYLIFPGGYYDANTFRVMKQEDFAAERSVESYWGITPSVRMDNVTVISVTPALSVSEIESMIGEAAWEKTVLILIFHKFSDTPDDWGMSYPPQDFERICECISHNELQVVPISALK